MDVGNEISINAKSRMKVNPIALGITDKKGVGLSTFDTVEDINGLRGILTYSNGYITVVKNVNGTLIGYDYIPENHEKKGNIINDDVFKGGLNIEIIS